VVGGVKASHSGKPVHYPPPPAGNYPPPREYAPRGDYGRDQHAQHAAHMYVSKILAGAIIGKAGVRINEIRARSGCVVKIEEVKERVEGTSRG
jgi:hypothetical protein